MEDGYIQNFPLDVDFTVYSIKGMEQAMEYAGHHKVFIDIYYYPKMTLQNGLVYS